MPVYYGGKSIIPAPPAISFKKVYVTNEDQTPIGTVWSISVKGTLSAYKGSPNSSGVFWTISGYPPDEIIPADSRLTSILRKQEGMRKLFAIHGQNFEVQPWDGNPPLKFNPRIKEIIFQEGKWVEVCNYEIVMEADVIYVNGNILGEDEDINQFKIQKSSENLHLEIINEFTKEYRLVHTVSAVGKLFYDDNGNITQEPWQNAKDYVNSKITDIDSSTNFNYIRTNNIGETTGEYSVTEAWVNFDTSLTPDGNGAGIPAIEVLTVNIRQSIDDQKVNVTLDGTITGLEQRDNITGNVLVTRYTNALAKYNAVFPFFLTRAQSFSGYTMNSVALLKQVSENNINGVITYNFSYNNRLAPSTSGALSEIITITDNIGSDVFALIPIPGRAIGPIIQDMDTVRENRRDITIEIVMPAATVDFVYPYPNTDSIVIPLIPSALQVLKEKDTPSYTPFTGRYTRQVSFVYQ